MKRLLLEPKPQRQPQKERKPAISHKAASQKLQKTEKEEAPQIPLKWLFEEAKDVVEDIFG